MSAARKIEQPAGKRTKKNFEARGVYTDDHTSGRSWFVEWYDHAGRLQRKRLGTKRKIKTEENARQLAYATVQEYIDRQYQLWLAKQRATPEEMEKMENRASFPREVVAREILRICDQRISGDVNDEASNGRPGLQLFADRVGISNREIHRIIDDPSRITAGVEVVDKICCEFDMTFDDFIDSARQWATQTGSWSNRPGKEDPWPFGYVPVVHNLGSSPI